MQILESELAFALDRPAEVRIAEMLREHLPLSLRQKEKALSGKGFAQSLFFRFRMEKLICQLKNQ